MSTKRSPSFGCIDYHLNPLLDLLLVCLCEKRKKEFQNLGPKCEREGGRIHSRDRDVL